MAKKPINWQEAGEFISYAEAAKLTKAYREENGDAPAPLDKRTGKPKVSKGAKKKYIKAFYFDKKNLEKLLSAEGCSGMRLYLGYDKKSKEKGERITPIFVGTRLGPDGIPADMVPSRVKPKKNDTETYTGEVLLLDRGGKWCPPDCGPANQLNGD